jgi:hypothetical protein
MVVVPVLVLVLVLVRERERERTEAILGLVSKSFVEQLPVPSTVTASCIT